MRIGLRRALLSACAIATTPAQARTVQDEQTWINATVIGTLAGTDIAYFAEVQPRFFDGSSRLGQALIRPAIGWRWSPEVTTYAGYAYVLNPVEDGRDREEDRLFLQLTWTLPKTGKGSFSSRTRLEHRRQSNGGDTGWRLREMVRYVHPIGDPDRTRALVHAEAFVAFNDTDWGARSGFDQLRTFLGAEVPLQGKSTLEIGYLNQTINRPAGLIRMNHVASISLFVRP